MNNISELHKDTLRKNMLKRKLVRLTEDLTQEQAGLIVPNIEEKREQFREAHSALRILEGKEPREVKTDG